MQLPTNLTQPLLPKERSTWRQTGQGRLRHYLDGLLVLAIALLCLRTGAQADVSLTRLPDGVRLLVKHEPRTGMVAVCVFVRAGQPEENGRAGAAALAARAFFGESVNLSREAVSRGIWMAGGSFESRAAPDYALFRFVTSPDAFRDAFYVVAQALKGAQYDRVSVDRARSSLLADLARQAFSPFDAADAALRPALYSTSAYGQSLEGTPDSLRRLTPALVAAFYQRWYTPDRTVISVVGDINPQTVERIVEDQLLPDYDRPAPRPLRPPDPEPPLGDTHTSLHLGSSTAIVMAGFRAPGVLDKDYPASVVLTALIGGGKGSRLFRAVRDTAGVGYSVGAESAPLAGESHMVAWVQYDPARPGPDGKPLDAASVQGRLLQAAQSVLTSPPTDREMGRARHYAAGTHVLAHQRSGDRAFYLGWYEVIDAGYAFDAELPKRLAAVTTDDVMRVARRCLAHYAVVSVGPAK